MAEGGDFMSFDNPAFDMQNHDESLITNELQPSYLNDSSLNTSYQFENPPVPQLLQREFTLEQKIDIINNLSKDTKWNFSREESKQLAQKMFKKENNEWYIKTNDKEIKITQGKGKKFLAPSTLKGIAAEFMKDPTGPRKSLFYNFDELPDQLGSATPEQLSKAGFSQDIAKQAGDLHQQATKLNETREHVYADVRILRGYQEKLETSIN